jgi:hypothetical protein
VISSAWRLTQRNSLPAIFREEGIIGEIIGATPSLGNRGEEIAAWLNSAAGRVTSFVIIDDADLGISNLFPDRFVKTRARTGFDTQHTRSHRRTGYLNLASPDDVDRLVSDLDNARLRKYIETQFIC